MHHLIDRKIVAVRQPTLAELMRVGWADETDYAYIAHGSVIIELDDGQRLIASRDEEGNGPGALFIFDGKNTYTLFA